MQLRGDKNIRKWICCLEFRLIGKKSSVFVGAKDYLNCQNGRKMKAGLC